MATLVSVYLEHVECFNCHGIFAVSREWMAQRQRDHAWWPCPYCATRQHWYGESDIERATRLAKEASDRLARERAVFDQEKARLKDRLAATESRRRAEKGAKTRLKNRAANGLCPCCNRYFANLHLHMTNQHPEFAATAQADETT